MRGLARAGSVVLFLLIIVLLGTSARAASQGFRDMRNHWAKTEVEALAQSDIISGYPDGTFRPEGTVTRAEFVKMAVLAEENGVLAGLKPTFTDTSKHWVHKDGYLETAVKWNLVQPADYPDGKFEPDRAITRLEMAIILVRAINKDQEADKAAGKKLSFKDGGQVAEKWRGYVDMAVQKGLVKGYEDNTFRPNRTATRAEAAVMILRRLSAAPTQGCYTHH